MDWIPTIITVIGFIIIYVHQDRKIKSLESIVNNQKTGIESQSLIVKNALDYANQFDPKKLENILKSTFEKEKEDEILKITTDYEKKLSELQSKEKLLKEGFSGLISDYNKSIDSIIKYMFNMMQDPLIIYLRFLLNLDKESRDRIVSNIKNESLRNIVLNAIGEPKMDLWSWGKNA